MLGGDGSVSIPDEYVEAGETIYAFIFLHTGEDDGETRYRISIPVDKRPRRGDVTPEQNDVPFIEQAIATMNAAAAKAESEAEAAERAKQAILDMTVEAETLAPESQATIRKVVDETTGEIKLEFGIPEGRQGIQGVPGIPGAPGKDGTDGKNGAVFTPAVSAGGVLSWTNSGDLPNPDAFNIVAAVLAALPNAEEGEF